MAGTVADITSVEELRALCGSHGGLTAVLIWASWHQPSVHLCKVFDAIARDQPTARFAKADADNVPDELKFGAEQVPFVAFLGPSGEKFDELAGADPPQLVQKVQLHAARSFPSACGAGACAPEEAMDTKLKRLINFSPVMLFMKGSKAEPFCKFSKQAVAMMGKYPDVEYSSFDILQDETVRQELKKPEWSNWATYPQLYVKGEFVGGVDIMREMDEGGELEEVLAIGKAETSAWNALAALDKRLEALTNQAPVMLFMKGNPDAPQCGFSNTIIEVLRRNAVEFESFDILTDDGVRQGLKEFSKWPTYPQLYAQGKLVGGLDLVKELDEEGALVAELGLEK